MPSFIRRIIGTRGDNLPPGWADWDGPWHVWCTGPRLTRVEAQQFASSDPRSEHDGSRYVLRGMTVWHLLSGDDSILVSRELGDVLARSCPDGLQFLSAGILDAPTGTHLTGYNELRPPGHITRDEILLLKPQGAAVWRYQAGGSHLFVSKPVMQAMREQHLGLTFSPGLSSFFD